MRFRFVHRSLSLCYIVVCKSSYYNYKKSTKCMHLYIDDCWRNLSALLLLESLLLLCLYFSKQEKYATSDPFSRGRILWRMMREENASNVSNVPNAPNAIQWAISDIYGWCKAVSQSSAHVSNLVISVNYVIIVVYFLVYKVSHSVIQSKQSSALSAVPVPVPVPVPVAIAASPAQSWRICSFGEILAMSKVKCQVDSCSFATFWNFQTL